jgi:hypothetical protein
MYSRRAFYTRIPSNNDTPEPIKCETSKLKFTMSAITSMALIIGVGSIIIVPGGNEMVFAINNVMLTTTPMKDINTPKKPMSMAVPSSQNAAPVFLGKIGIRSRNNFLAGSCVTEC